MTERARAGIRSWLGELAQRRWPASLVIAGERLHASFAAVQDDRLLMDAVALDGLRLPFGENQEVLVEFRDSRKTGSCRFLTSCRRIDAVAPDRLSLSLEFPVEIGWADQRRHVRARVAPDALQAAVWVGRARRAARVLEISAGGAKMRIAPHDLRLDEARAGTQFTIQLSGPAVQGLPDGCRESAAVVRRVVRSEPPWVLAVELIRPPEELVAALADYAQQADS